MKLLIPIGQFNLSDSKSVQQFAVFIRVSLINKLKYIIINNKERFNTLLTPFSVTVDELLNSISRLIVCVPCGYGLIIGYSNKVYVNNVSVSTILKSIDFGSKQTGKGHKIFTSLIKEIQVNITDYYKSFIGLRF